MAPILLQCATVTQQYDPAGVLVDMRVLPTYNPGYYAHNLLADHLKPLDTFDYVPPLEYFCLKTLYPRVDSIDLGDRPRFSFHPQAHMTWLKGLVPFFTSDTRDVDMKYVDPRLWGTLIQVYSTLPPCFHTYTLPLSDMHLTRLQAIRSTPDFTLITVLDMSSRCELTDETIGELKPLTNLCVLDLSLTKVGSWGVRKLSMCLVRKHDKRMGPWGVRVWSLRGCKNVDDTAKDALAKFPLLSAVDLRDTSVSPFSQFHSFSSHPPLAHMSFYHPYPPLSWIDGLCESFPESQVFRCNGKESLHIIHINKLEYPKLFFRHHSCEGRNMTGAVGEHDKVLALFSRGKRVQFTTHELSQDPDQILNSRKDPSPKSRKAARSLRDPYRPTRTHDFDNMGEVDESGYGEFPERGLLLGGRSGDGFPEDFPSNFFDDSYMGEDDGSEYDDFRERTLWRDDQSEDSFPVDRHSDDDPSEGWGSEGKRSKHDNQEFDQNSHNNAALTGSSFDLDSNQSEDHPMFTALDPVVQQNEVAVLVTMRHAAEQEARQFYRNPDIPVRGAGRLLVEGHGSMTDLSMMRVGQMQRPIPQLPPSEQWSRMFFRIPPDYNSINHDGTPETGHVRRQKPDEAILAKKRKVVTQPTSLPNVLLNRRPKVAPPHRGEGPQCSITFRRPPTQQPDEEPNPRPSRMSRNPFLKRDMKRLALLQPSLSLNSYSPSSRSRSTTPSRPTGAVQPTSESTSRALRARRNPFRALVSSSGASYTMQTDEQGSACEEESSLNRDNLIQMKPKQIFDMRAWATQTNG